MHEFLIKESDSNTIGIESQNLGLAQGNFIASEAHFLKNAQCHAFALHFFATLRILKFLITGIFVNI